MSIMTTNDSFVKDLMKVLGLPDNVKRFKLVCEPESMVTVVCEYYPDIKDTETIFRQFILQKK